MLVVASLTTRKSDVKSLVVALKSGGAAVLNRMISTDCANALASVGTRTPVITMFDGEVNQNPRELPEKVPVAAGSGICVCATTISETKAAPHSSALRHKRHAENEGLSKKPRRCSACAGSCVEISLWRLGSQDFIVSPDGEFG
jgi:hypothetical protein